MRQDVVQIAELVRDLDLLRRLARVGCLLDLPTFGTNGTAIQAADPAWPVHNLC
ncbi:MAG: hypothetical protein ACREVZ_03170 [Burkholderiales bacterium]